MCEILSITVCELVFCSSGFSLADRDSCRPEWKSVTSGMKMWRSCVHTALSKLIEFHWYCFNEFFIPVNSKLSSSIFVCAGPWQFCHHDDELAGLFAVILLDGRIHSFSISRIHFILFSKIKGKQAIMQLKSEVNHIIFPNTKTVSIQPSIHWNQTQSKFSELYQTIVALGAWRVVYHLRWHNYIWYHCQHLNQGYLICYSGLAFLTLIQFYVQFLLNG
jgi:hypothetical protein